MKIEELIEALKLNEEQTELVSKFKQSTEDIIRTDYSKQLKAVNDELTKYKPTEQTAEQKELEQLRSEMKMVKFKNSLRDANIPNDLAGFINPNIKVEEVIGFFEHHPTLDVFVPNHKNMGSVEITKEQFKTMNISERTKLYESSPELYDQLSK